MTRLSLTLFKITALALFMWVQSAGLAHASVYGDGDHQHDGVDCELVLVASEDEVLQPVAPTLAPPQLNHASVTPLIHASPLWLRPPCRAPPPRGPPSIAQT